MADSELSELSLTIKALRAEVSALRAEIERSRSGSGSGEGVSKMGIGPANVAAVGAYSYFNTLKSIDASKSRSMHDVKPSWTPGNRPAPYIMDVREAMQINARDVEKLLKNPEAAMRPWPQLNLYGLKIRSPGVIMGDPMMNPSTWKMPVSRDFSGLMRQVQTTKFGGYMPRANVGDNMLLRRFGAKGMAAASMAWKETGGELFKMALAYSLVTNAARVLSEDAWRARAAEAEATGASEWSLAARDVGRGALDTAHTAMIAGGIQNVIRAGKQGWAAGRLATSAAKAAANAGVVRGSVAAAAGRSSLWAGARGALSTAGKASLIWFLAETVYRAATGLYGRTERRETQTKELSKEFSNEDLSEIMVNQRMAKNYIKSLYGGHGWAREFVAEYFPLTAPFMTNINDLVKEEYEAQLVKLKEANKMAAEAKHEAILGNWKKAEQLGEKAVRKAEGWGMFSWCDPAKWFSRAEQAAAARRSFARWSNTRIRKRVGD